MTTPAEDLRTAAAKLRELIAAVSRDIDTNPYWTSDEHPPHDHSSLYARGVDGGLGGPAGAFAAAMHPGVGAALADWLDSAAEDAEQIGADYRALAVARAINGGQS